MTESKVLFWAVGAGATSSILMWWFRTRLPIHVLEVLKVSLFWTKSSSFWVRSQEIGGKTFEVPLNNFSSSDFEKWVEDKAGKHVAELFSCPGCLSAHVSFWVALTGQLLVGFDSLLFISCWLTWPVISNAFLVYLKK